MRLHYLKHVPFEDIGSIREWAVLRNVTVSCTELYKGHELPSVEDFDALVVMGGPMNIYDEEQYPWLVKEKEFIKEAVEERKSIVGICLGAQLIADVLGSKVYENNHSEIGWYEVEKSIDEFPFLEEKMTVFHWHGDTFDLPAGAIRLYRSETCMNQAFIYNNRVIALQFHLEANTFTARELVDNCADDIVDGEYIQTAAELFVKTKKYSKKANNAMFQIMDYLSNN